jgi:hypothetical protein
MNAATKLPMDVGPIHFVGIGGCLATEEDGAIRLQAALGEIDEEITQARLSRVAAVAPDPDLASQACFEALRLAAPEAAVP